MTIPLLPTEPLLPGQEDKEPAEPLEFWVPGRAQTAGSKSAITKNRDGSLRDKALIVDSGNRPDKKAWRTDIRDACSAAMARQQRQMWPKGVPIDALFVFVRKRPSDQTRSGRHEGEVKEAAVSERPVKMPDLLKTARAVEDALTSVAYADDAAIVVEELWKAFGDQVGLEAGAEGLYVRLRRASLSYDGPRLARGAGVEREL